MKPMKTALLYIGGHPIEFKGYDLIAIARDRLKKHGIHDAIYVKMVPTTFAPVYSFETELGIVKGEMIVMDIAL